MAELFNTTKQNVSLHANNCFKEGELDMKSVVKDFLTTASDGKLNDARYLLIMLAIYNSVNFDKSYVRMNA
ncbi:hypothetical protein SAMN05216349_1411 [Oribacterium sp. KHPX15]|nr:hypothetical protein SAMN05216349_1411 [Oribacterium sp. KHPX15]